MKISATESLNAAHVIPDAAVLRIRYEDDTVGFYAIPRDLVDVTAQWACDMGAMVYRLTEGEALSCFDDGAWIGIRVASTGSVGAWGRAVLAEVAA